MGGPFGDGDSAFRTAVAMGNHPAPPGAEAGHGRRLGLHDLGAVGVLDLIVLHEQEHRDAEDGEPGGDQQVTIRFQPLVAQNVAEVVWHKTQRTEFNPDGTLDFHVTVSGLGEISWWILGYGDQAEVLAPKKLRDIVVRRAKNLVARYESGKTSK